MQELEEVVAATSRSDTANVSVLGDVLQLDAGRLLRKQKLFLDSDLHTQPASMGADDDNGTFPIPPTILRKLGSADQQAETAARYFATAHRWMPFVSKVKWDRWLCSTSRKPSPGHLILLLAMQLVQQRPASSVEAAENPLYAACKRWNADLDAAGAHTLQRLQASLLIAVYEIGHGVLPSGYLTLGSIAALAVALGVHDDEAPQMLPKPKNWIGWEERLRTWWMVRILDR